MQFPPISTEAIEPCSRPLLQEIQGRIAAAHHEQEVQRFALVVGSVPLARYLLQPVAGWLG